MKTNLQSRAAQRGFTYATVVVTMIVVGTMLAAYLKMVAVQNQSTVRSQSWNRTVPVLEAGVEEALAHLNHNATPVDGVFTTSALAMDGWSNTVDMGWYKVGQLGDDYYYTTISKFVGGHDYPFIQSTGYVRNLPTLALKTQFGPFLAAGFDELLKSGLVAKRTVLCTTTNVPTFTKALVAKRSIIMSGQNVRTDSFDSATNSPYNDGYGHYTNSPGKWKTNGDIASNDTITNTIETGNANIFGKVATGPLGTIKLGVSGMVGDVAWQSDAVAHGGKIQPGWSTDDMNMDFPSITVPTNVSWQAVNGSSLMRVIGTETYDIVLTGGLPNMDGTAAKSVDYYMAGNQVLSGKIYVTGKVRLLVGTKINMSGTDKIVLAPGASIQLIADCATASLGGNGVQNPGMANDFYYFGTDKNTTLAYGGNASFTGVFYAPNADMTMSGGGGGQLDFSGAAIARSIKLTGNFTFHYDENLQRVGLYRGYVLTSWNEK
jgi:hypothetical protein